MGAVFGSLAALSIGILDLFGRRLVATRGVLAATAGLQAIAVLASLAALMVISSDLRLDDITLGALSGVGFGLGVLTYYSGLSRSTAAVVAPLAATLATIVPFTYAAVTQTTPSRLALVGVAVAVVGLVLLTAGGQATTNVRAGVCWGVAAGLSYGFGQTFMIDISSDSGAWPAVSQRFVAFLLLATMASGARVSLMPPKGLRLATVLAGVFAALSTAFFLAGVQLDATAAVVTISMFPAVTVGIGYVYFSDAVSRRQVGGLCAVLVGVGLVVTG